MAGDSPREAEAIAYLLVYLLSRHSLKSSGLDSPELADYVSGVLEFFLEAGFHPHTNGRGVFYVVDWLQSEAMFLNMDDNACH